MNPVAPTPCIPPAAHYRPTIDGSQERHPLEEHLAKVGERSAAIAGKIGLETAGELAGLLHDLGKYSGEFQAYLASATGALDQDGDGREDASALKGKIDHSTAGAQFLWRSLPEAADPLELLVRQMISLCIASHHSGLIDCLTSCPGHPVDAGFLKRMAKPEAQVHLEETLSKAGPILLRRINHLLDGPELREAFRSLGVCITSRVKATGGGQSALQFRLGLVVRFLLSALLDADRMDTAAFMQPGRPLPNEDAPPWDLLIQRLETRLQAFPIHNSLDHLRHEISAACLGAASGPLGLRTLTAPTGAGKTLAQLRFALHHARHHRLDRIIFVVPFTSIIDQNADVARTILEEGDPIGGHRVLEHHSNLSPDLQTWRSKLQAENWDAPVIFTTSVQLLETLFGSGTRSARRMHTLSRAVIIFDEVQALPIRCVHLFNSAMNFLVDHCGTSAVLSTATQPLLHRVDPGKGALQLSQGHELIPDVERLFRALKRVDVRDARKAGGWSDLDIAALAVADMNATGSCLVVVNTKAAARRIHAACATQTTSRIVHLSTSMCPCHRRSVLKGIREALEERRPILCVSTQLIEAGVDVDFGSAIRFLAGLDSIAQTAGRCNRHARRPMGRLDVINPTDESLQYLPDIRIGRDLCARVLDEFRQQPEAFDGDLLGPKALARYFEYCFFQRAGVMDYPLDEGALGRADTLLNLLGTNDFAMADFQRNVGMVPPMPLRQSFRAAGEAFKAIEAATQGALVPYGDEGRALVAALQAVKDSREEAALLARSQGYSVNIFPHEWSRLQASQALQETQQGSGIYILDPRFYHPDYGLSTYPVTDMEVLLV